MNKPIPETYFNNFNNMVMDSLVGSDPIPISYDDYLESEQYKILKNFLTHEQRERRELFPISQWKEALELYLPDQLKYLIKYINLIDINIEDHTEYNKIVEECYYNITEIQRFATLFIKAKDKSDIEYNPIQIGNVFKHLSTGLISEVSKLKYYSEERSRKLSTKN